MSQDVRVALFLCKSSDMSLSTETPLEILILGGGVAGQCSRYCARLTMLTSSCRPYGCHGPGQVLT